MNSLLNPTDSLTFVNRINTLKPDTPAKWGKMNASQMLAHCNCGLGSALGDVKDKRMFLGYIFGSIGKKDMLKDEPFKQSLPTAKTFVKIGEQPDFNAEKATLLKLIDRYTKGGEAAITTHPHTFFGPMTPAEWDHLMTKHLDHHLRQFGV